jgi:catechol 2,3-dioxygenase-like lactoylglutathione lyase family enzyme
MASRARLVGLNHVVLEVGELQEALQFYGRLLEIKLRGTRSWSDAAG